MASVVRGLPRLVPPHHGRTAVYQDDWEQYADGQTWRLVIGKDVEGPTPNHARKRAHNWAARQLFLVKCRTRLMAEGNEKVLYVEYLMPESLS